MNDVRRRILPAVLAAGLAFGVAACETDDTVENEIQDVEDAVEEGASEVEDAAEEGASEVEDAAEDAQDELDDEG